MTEQSRMTYLASGPLFDLARKAMERSQADRNESLTAVILAAISFEAFLNDFLELIRSVHDKRRPREILECVAVCEELENDKAKVLTKLNTAYLLLTHKRLPRGSEPFQSLELLLRLRNIIVHKRPDSTPLPLPKGSRPNHPVIRQLVSRGLIDQPYPRDASFTFVWLIDPRVATWAYKTASEARGVLVEALPDSQAREMLRTFLASVSSE